MYLSIRVGIWNCYCQEAFRNPDVFYLLFLRPEISGLDGSITEYYEMFPKAVEKTSESFLSMLKQKDFMALDLDACKKCVEAGAIIPENGGRLNRMDCLVNTAWCSAAAPKLSYGRYADGIFALQRE